MLGPRTWSMTAALAVALLLPQWELLGSRRVSFAVDRDAPFGGQGRATVHVYGRR